MIPSITLTVPVPYERLKHSCWISPAHERGITMEEVGVSMEFAAFLINQEELDKDEYITELFVHMYDNDTGFRDKVDRLSEQYSEVISEHLLSIDLESELVKCMENDKTGWSDHV